jgi:hypothetical protein
VALLPCLLASIGGLWLAASSKAIFNIRAAVPTRVQTYEPDQQTKNTAGTVPIIFSGYDRHRQTDGRFSFSPSLTCLHVPGYANQYSEHFRRPAGT